MKRMRELSKDGLRNVKLTADITAGKMMTERIHIKELLPERKLFSAKADTFMSI